MAKILFVTYSLHGHLFPCISVAKELQKRKHEIGFVSFTAARKYLDEEKFLFFSLNKVASFSKRTLCSQFPTDFFLRHWIPVLQFPQDPFEFFETIQKKIPSLFLPPPEQILQGLMEAEMEDLMNATAKWKPDFIIFEETLQGSVFCFPEIKKIPCALFTTYISTYKIPGQNIPPHCNGFSFPLSQESGIDWYYDFLRGLFHFPEERCKSVINRVRQKYGLPRLNMCAHKLFEQVPLYLIPSISEFDYDRKDLPLNAHYVGPCCWDPQKEALPSWVEELPHDTPLIFLSEGTTYSHKPVLLKTAISVLGSLPVQVVITLGGRKTENLGPLPANVKVVPFFPLNQIISKFDFAIHQGGAGVTMNFLKAGIPQIIAPLQGDQDENARRLERIGAGIRIPPFSLHEEMIKKSLFRLFRDDSFRKNARSMADKLSSLNGPANAAQLIEETLLQ